MSDTTLPDGPKKRPAFQFYPADWRKDVELRSCSLAARGLWIDLLCVAHECEPYGHLMLNGRPMTPAQMAGQVGNANGAQVAKLLAELLENGVARKTSEGAIYSKRMVEDERVRNARAEGGKAGAEHGFKGAEAGSKGGRPKRTEGGSETPLKVEQKPPPSSSSSSSTSVGVGRASRLPTDWEPGDTGYAFAASKGLTNGIAHEELEKFRDHWAAKPGREGTALDWQAKWRTWVRNSLQFRSKAGASSEADIFAGAR